MSVDADHELVGYIKSYNDRGVSPENAKNALLNAGYTADEIDEAAAQAGVAAAQATQDGNFNAGQAAAIAMSNSAGEEAESQLRTQSTLYGAVGGFDPLNAVNPITGPAEYEFLSNIGLSYWKVFLIMASALGALYFFHLPRGFITLVEWAFGLFIFYVFLDRFWISRLRHKK
jgi:hypothetical protein